MHVSLRSTSDFRRCQNPGPSAIFQAVVETCPPAAALGQIQWKLLPKAGEELVRRAVQGSPTTKKVEIRHSGYLKSSHGHQSVAAPCLPLPEPNKVKVAVEAFGLTDLESDLLLTAFVGSIDGKRVVGCSYQKIVDTVAVNRKAITSLPESVSVEDVVSLPIAVLPAWVGLVEVGRVEKNSIVLVHDALSRMPPLFSHLRIFASTFELKLSGVLLLK